MVGADVAALRRLASSLRHAQHEIEASRRRLSAIVGGLPWTGPDHERFVDEWRRVHGPALVTIVAEMSESSGRAAHHADRQEQASRRHP